MIENKLIGMIKTRLLEVAIGTCEHPSEDLAKYNRQVGIYLGLQESLNMLESLLQEDDERDR